MEHDSIDSNEEESDNSSEDSFNEVANVALAVGYAMSGLLLPPQVPSVYQPVYLQPDLTGRQWVENVLAAPIRCLDNFRMQPRNFYRLHHLLTTHYGLKTSRNIHTKEALGMFLWAVGTRQPMRQMKERFRRGIGTCSKMITTVLNAMMPFADDVLRSKDNTYAAVPDELKEYSPLFDGCIGAIDGTHIEVCVDEAFHDDFTNRHGWRSQNVICVCDFNMMFTYVGVGTEGSAHDMRVLKKKALMDWKFPHPPKGRYYLVDSGYANREGYMPPHPCTRYHVKEFKKGAPRNAEELFNKYHSLLRNVIERTFGCAKSKWQLLNGIPHYPLIKQSQLVMAACALHNYVHELEGPKRPARYRQPGGLGSLGQVLAMALRPGATTEEIREWITLGLPLLQNNSMVYGRD